MCALHILDKEIGVLHLFNTSWPFGRVSFSMFFFRCIVECRLNRFSHKMIPMEIDSRKLEIHYMSNEYACETSCHWVQWLRGYSIFFLHRPIWSQL